MVRGGCNCGAVAWEVDGALGEIYVCHCSICRRWTGTNGVAVIVVPKESFRWLRGEASVRSWRKPDADWASSFCNVCGSALPGENDAERMFVPAGAITKGGEGLVVADHIFVDSRAPWDVIGDGGRQHAGHLER
ncbi:MAG: GFA family protein [Pseudomonadales bacterium]|jgi:hypothetical protein|nr:GFA family protein [Pseudomonadales bacterium]